MRIAEFIYRLLNMIPIFIYPDLSLRGRLSADRGNPGEYLLLILTTEWLGLPSIERSLVYIIQKVTHKLSEADADPSSSRPAVAGGLAVAGEDLFLHKSFEMITQDLLAAESY